MANKLKSRKSQQPEPGKLKPEKEETVQVKHLVKDERTHKIVGALLIALGAFLLIAFVSYLFTWQEDQDKVFNNGAGVLFSNDVKVANLVGWLGAWTSHFFIYNGFGLASFLLCSLFFVIGINLLLKRKYFSIARNLRYVLTGLLFFSVAFAFLLPAEDFPWGGAVGNLASAWLVKMLGWTGTAVLLSLAGLAWFIWRFNPVFSLPEKKAKLETIETDTTDGTVIPAVAVTEPVTSQPEKNYLKSEGGVVVIPPPVDGNKNGLNDFKVIEKEEQSIPATVQEPLPVNTIPTPEPTPKITEPVKPIAQRSNLPDLELEIKPVLDEVDENEIIVDETTAVPELPPYEPTLDLVNYKYPSLDLLENHGSEKIIQDPAELETNKNQIINTLKNYDIDIQKISATVGPTVTLYEIVPAAGVRISRSRTWRMISH